MNVHPLRHSIVFDADTARVVWRDAYSVLNESVFCKCETESLWYKSRENGGLVLYSSLVGWRIAKVSYNNVNATNSIRGRWIGKNVDLLNENVGAQLSFGGTATIGDLNEEQNNERTVSDSNYCRNSFNWIFSELLDTPSQRAIITLFVCLIYCTIWVAINLQRNCGRIAGLVGYGLIGFFTPLFSWWALALYLLGKLR